MTGRLASEANRALRVVQCDEPSAGLCLMLASSALCARDHRYP
jgi:hypothetical protein